MAKQVLSRKASGLAAVTTAAVGALVIGRVVRDGVQMHGCDGAPYIEHVARLATLKAWREGSLLAPWDLLVSMDGDFPPLMHLLALPLGALAGHDANTVLWSGFLWLLLLAAAVGSVVVQLSGQRVAGLAAFVGTLLLPAAHGFATRYYYDLPMTALIWASAAYVLRWGDRKPVRAGLGGGLLLAGAALVKWSALPFGLPVLVGAALCVRQGAKEETVRERLRRSMGVAGIACAVVFLFSWLFLWSSGADNSYQAMSAQSFQNSDSAPLPSGIDALLPGPVAFVVGEALAGIERIDGSELAFYSMRLVTSVYSPLLAAALALLSLLWLALDRRAVPLLLLVVLGQGAFLLLVLSMFDDRFLLTGAVLPVVLGSLGWARCSDGVRAVIAVLVVVLGLAVAADFHFGQPASWNEAVEWRSSPAQGQPPVVRRGLGLASSVQRLGWVRADEQENARTPYREALWGAMGRCRFGRIAELDGWPILGGCGNRFWWEYRGDLEEVNGESPGRLPFRSGYVWSVQDTGYGERGSNGPELLLVGEDPAGSGKVLPDEVDGKDWQQLARVEDPEGGRGSTVWTRYDADPCDTHPEADDPREGRSGPTAP